MANERTKKTYELVRGVIKVPVADIIPTKNNPRHIDEKSESFKELVESIRAQGVLVPIHIRNHPKKKDKFELLAGERRLLASKAVGFGFIDAINHGQISDAEAFEITFTENFAREDLTVMEEGSAVAILLKKFKGDAKAVASKLGRTERWVGLRKQLEENLSQKWKEAIDKNTEGIGTWSAGHFGLVARLPQQVQDEIYDHLDCEFRCEWINCSVKELEKVIDNYIRMLSKAPWQLDDPGIVKKAGACSKCSKRSSAQPKLWDDPDDAEKPKKNDRCLDKKCWTEKFRVWNKLHLAELKNDHPNLVLVATEHTTLSEDEELEEIYGSYLEKYQYSLSGKKAKGAVPALVVHGPGEGEIKYIKTNRSSSGSGRGKVPGQPTPLKVRRKQLESKRWQQVLRELVQRIHSYPLTEFHKNITPVQVMTLAAVFGTENVYEHSVEWEDFEKLWEQLKQKRKKPGTTVESLLIERASEALWQKIEPVLANRMTYNGPITQVPDKMIAEAKKIAKLMAIDIDKLYGDQVEAIKEPKSWKNLNADGTQKKAKAKKKKKAKAKKTAKKTAKKKVTTKKTTKAKGELNGKN